MKRRSFFRTTAIAGVLMASGVLALSAQAADTIKVGILHSLSGTMAISETTLKDTALMAIAEIVPFGAVNRLMRRARSRKMAPMSVALMKFWKSLLVEPSSSILIFSYWLTVLNSSLTDCSSSLLVSSSSADDQVSRLIRTATGRAEP